MLTNNQTTDKDTNVPYKLPTDVESRFNRDIYMPHESSCNSEVHLVAECNCDKKIEYGVKQFIATEQVTLLESMVSDIEKMKKQKWIIKTVNHYSTEGYVSALDDVIAKVQAKIKEYKV